ncbi:MarR family transcriptional regulator [Streptomyces violarus]|uniref:MarR family transcriptional regulator n=1 Tax=Streptomyces violarus TaxID=67380 RepID=UPI0021C24857|nr:helix-turn-helix domain-containing protein [Streptomyces violarus]MCT9139449.1 ArsR family transcriptional regulator [Streptomyces violarus]
MTHPDRRWTFLTSHARVLVVIAWDPDAHLRTIAAACRITERAVQSIIGDLEQGGYLHRRRIGRRNQYILHLDQPPRHPAEASLSVRALVELATAGAPHSPETASASATV